VGQIHILTSDITRMKVDAIVNAANSTLLGGGGVDGAIHTAAGPQLLDYCRGLGGCPTGEARISPGFNLPARFVIHTVGPVWQGGRHGEADLLKDCYENSFRLAQENGVQRIAFPAISTGVYGYPKIEATEVALASMRRWVGSFDKIFACCFSQSDADLYAEKCPDCLSDSLD
jgi:O-acetyl-ADP-ribose deacetylase